MIVNALAYSIGKKLPLAKSINTFNSGNTNLKKIEKYAWSLLDLSVAGINSGLQLRKPMYQETARYGHFGHSKYPWEKIV